MQSIQIPENIVIHLSSNFIRVSGPQGSTVFNIQGFNVDLFQVNSTKRLVIRSVSPSYQNSVCVASILSQIQSAISGVHVGYRRRLRLNGVGFRAFSAQQSKIVFKLGYSHDVEVETDSIKSKNISISTSRIEGRSKGTLISLQGRDRAFLHHWTSTIRKLRVPDSYKGKGIHFDGEKIVLKKGKREALSRKKCQ